MDWYMQGVLGVGAEGRPTMLRKDVRVMRTNEIYSSQIPKTRRSSGLMDALLVLLSRAVMGVCMYDIRYRSTDVPITDQGSPLHLSSLYMSSITLSHHSTIPCQKLNLISAICLSLSIRRCRCLYTTPRRPGGPFPASGATIFGQHQDAQHKGAARSRGRLR